MTDTKTRHVTVFLHDHNALEQKALDIKILSPQSFVETVVTYPARAYKRGEAIEHQTRLEAERFCILMQNKCEIVVSPDPNHLPIFVVYDRPSDFPDHYVVREFRGPTVALSALTFDDLESARAHLAEHGLVRLDRHPSDDPKILETWL